MVLFGVKLWITLLKKCKKNLFFLKQDTQSNCLVIFTNKYPDCLIRQIHKICTLFLYSEKCKNRLYYQKIKLKDLGNIYI